MPFRQQVASEEEFKATIAKIADDFKPHVVRIRYNVARDFQNQECLFFRVVLRDGKIQKLLRICGEVRERIQQEIDSANIGYWLHCYFRTEKEQKMLREKEWE